MTNINDNINFEKYLLNSLCLRVEDSKNKDFTNDFNKIVNDLSERKFTILFPFYWSHQVVEKFKNDFKENVKFDDYSWYLRTLNSVINSERQIHWIEKINLFHCFGFTRYFDDAGELIINDLKVNIKEIQDFNDMTDISAFTWLSTKLSMDFNDIKPYLKLLRSNKELVSTFAMYQIYYYGGVKNCLQTLKKYLNDSQRSIVVPHSILSLLFVEKNLIFEELRNEKETLLEIFEKLPTDLKDLIYYETK